MQDGTNRSIIKIEDQLYGVLLSGSTFDIPSQNIIVSGKNYLAKGSGSVNGSQLKYNLNLSGSGSSIFMNFNGTR